MTAVPPLAGDPALRRRARQRHVVGRAGAARDRAAGGDRPAGRGRRRRRGDRPAARRGRRRRQLRARAAAGRGPHARVARGAASASPPASGCRARSRAARPGCCTTRASSTRRRRCRARCRRARTPSAARRWIEGFIGTSGLVLVHDPELLAVLDGWVARVPDDAFTNVLPLLRRAFSVLPAGERRRLGERLSQHERARPLNLDSHRCGAGARRAGDRGEAARWLRSGCAAGGSCSAGRTPRGQACASRARTAGSTARWTRSTASAGATWAARRRRSRAGWASCAAHFPSGVVRVVQQDAIDRLGLHRLLLEPEVLENVTPDVHLAATLMSLRDALPEASRRGRAAGGPAGGGGHRAAAVGAHAGGREGRAGPQLADQPARSRARSTGTARSAPTCATTSPSTRR